MGQVQRRATPFANASTQIVSVSNTSCTSATGNGNECSMAGATVCQVVREPNYCRHIPRELCPVTVDCKGATGTYVRVQLPGDQRIFDARVRVNLAKPPRVAGRGSVCYGVEARKASTTMPDAGLNFWG